MWNAIRQQRVRGGGDSSGVFGGRAGGRFRGGGRPSDMCRRGGRKTCGRRVVSWGCIGKSGARWRIEVSVVCGVCTRRRAGASSSGKEARTTAQRPSCRRAVTLFCLAPSLNPSSRISRCVLRLSWRDTTDALRPISFSTVFSFAPPFTHSKNDSPAASTALRPHPYPHVTTWQSALLGMFVLFTLRQPNDASAYRLRFDSSVLLPSFPHLFFTPQPVTTRPSRALAPRSLQRAQTASISDTQPRLELLCAASRSRRTSKTLGPFSTFGTCAAQQKKLAVKFRRVKPSLCFVSPVPPCLSIYFSLTMPFPFIAHCGTSRCCGGPRRGESLLM